MFCAISGEVPQEPVVAKTTGLLFEKKIILKALKLEKKCPVTGTELSEEDLLTIAANPIPPLRAAAPTHVNGLLYTLQQEWDETVLETFNLRQQLDTTRKELAHALYQYDAACRVIARLVKERDEAFNLLQSYQINGTTNHSHHTVPQPQPQQQPQPAEQAMEVDQPTATTTTVEPGISEEVINELNGLCKQLSADRKKRKPSPEVQTKDHLAQYHEIQSLAPHKRESITAIAVKASHDGSNHQILSGSTDQSIIVSDYATGKVQGKLTGHRDTVTSVAFSPISGETIFSGSEDQTVKIWQANTSGRGGGYTEQLSIPHSGAVKGLTVQPSGNYLVSCTDQGNWHFIDARQGVILKSVGHKRAQIGYQTTCFHPDGLILSTGTVDGDFTIWDVREQKEISTLKESESSIQSIAFSENGYLTATGHRNGEVKIWDLRKLTCMKSFSFGPTAINAVSFDYSGLYLGIGGGGDTGNRLEVKVVKDWSTLLAVPVQQEEQVTGLAWTTHAQALIAGTNQGAIRVFAK